jgi:DNA gyrase subunit B
MADDTPSNSSGDDEIKLPNDAAYDAESLKHLSDMEHVRARPSMYIGDTTLKGLHHLVYEVVDNSIDEVMANYAKLVTVQINTDGSVTVEDDGRGIPVSRHPQLSEQMQRDVSTLEGVMTVLKFGGKFEKTAYKTSGGLHGVGVTVVNFLSAWCEVEVSREGFVWTQGYERGVATGPVLKGHATSRNGTKTTFKPDSDIFPNTKFNYDTLHKRLQELAFLNSGVRIRFKDERINQSEEFYYERGIEEFVQHLNRASDTIHPDVLLIKGERDAVSYEVALQYSAEYTENVQSYVNNIHTIEGGTHVSGFRAALTRALNTYGKKENLLENLTPTGEDFREGLTAVISIRVPHPQFEGQTKSKLGNSEVEGIINTAVGEHIQKYLEENPKSAKSIVKKGLIACEAREAARKAKELLRQRKSALSGGGLPGKLRDCISSKMEECEVYLVEGDSAGGSAEGGRFREFQAILPLRGKIINAYKSREDKVLANEEVKSMIQAIGCGIGEDQDISKRRYNKVIIMTDADVDGSHIRTLLLCFFYRQMYHLVAGGHVYLAQPPLYRVVRGKNRYYVQTDDVMKTQLLERGLTDCWLHSDSGTRIEGDQMRRLCKTLAAMEDALIALEKRGISLKEHAQRMDQETHRLPMFLLTVGKDMHWFHSRELLDSFIGKEKIVLDGQGKDGPEDTNNDGVLAHYVEMHEVKSINTGLKDINELGFTVRDLIPEQRTGSTESKFYLHREENRSGIDDLRSLLPAIRAAGEKGMQLTRFKGLGEMNPEELRETTLDPHNRTLVKVTLTDAAAADEMFRVLMGDKVEPRREFIEKHALDVRNLDV